MSEPRQPELTEATAIEIARRESFVVPPPLVADVRPSYLGLIELRVTSPATDMRDARDYSCHLHRWRHAGQMAELCRRAWVDLKAMAEGRPVSPLVPTDEPEEPTRA